jgi:hypothetical protein
VFSGRQKSFAMHATEIYKALSRVFVETLTLKVILAWAREESSRALENISIISEST